MVQIKHFFRVHIKQYSLSKSYYQTRANTFLGFISNITATLRELLQKNTTHFSRHQAILTCSESGKQYNTLFQSLYQAILTFSESGKQYNTLFQSLYQAILTFSESGKQYNTLFQSLYQEILIFSEIPFQIKL